MSGGFRIGGWKRQEARDLSEADSNARIEHFSSLNIKFQREQSWAGSWWSWCENLDEESVD